ncbi:unnamed protein product [Discosporangium mesarthrocarpum]
MFRRGMTRERLRRCNIVAKVFAALLGVACLVPLAIWDPPSIPNDFNDFTTAGSKSSISSPSTSSSIISERMAELVTKGSPGKRSAPSTPSSRTNSLAVESDLHDPHRNTHGMRSMAPVQLPRHLLWVRIPKTASHSFQDILSRSEFASNSKTDACLLCPYVAPKGGMWPHCPDACHPDWGRLVAEVSATYGSSPGHDYGVLAFFRNPDQRVWSEFNHIQSNHKSCCARFCWHRAEYRAWCRPERGKCTLSRFLENRLPCNEWNKMTRMVAGTGGEGSHWEDWREKWATEEDLLSAAKENLRSMLFFGISERFAESVSLYKRMLNVSFPHYINSYDANRHFRGKSSPLDQLNQQDRTTLEAANRLDHELYRLATEMFEERLHLYGVAPNVTVKCTPHKIPGKKLDMEGSKCVLVGENTKSRDTLNA